MDFNEYQQLASRTLIPGPGRQIPTAHLFLIEQAIELMAAAVRVANNPHVTLFPKGDQGIMLKWNVTGLVGECGELVEMFKKYVFHQHDLNLEKFADELGDIMWYLAAICTKLDMPMADVVRVPGLMLNITNDLRMVYRSLLGIAAQLGLDMDEIMTANIEKLKRCYPDGWTVADSVARVDVA